MSLTKWWFCCGRFFCHAPSGVLRDDGDKVKVHHPGTQWGRSRVHSVASIMLSSTEAYPRISSISCKGIIFHNSIFNYTIKPKSDRFKGQRVIGDIRKRELYVNAIHTWSTHHDMVIFSPYLFARYSIIIITYKPDSFEKNSLNV